MQQQQQLQISLEQQQEKNSKNDQKPLQNEQQQIENQLKNIYQINSQMKFNAGIIKGYDFNEGINYDKMFSQYQNFGIQSSQFGKAIEIINKMIKWRLSDEPIKQDANATTTTDDFYDEEKDPNYRKNVRCTIFLGYTSNMVSSGIREIIRYLVQHKMVDCIVSTAGGIEEDFIKCLAPFYQGDWSVNDIEMRKQSMNRIGNIFVPSENYCKFEQWLLPIFKEMYDEQINQKKIWTPRSLIQRLGEKINNEESIYFWAAKNNIPVFCPAITDGAIGDMLFFNSFKNDGFILDLVQDISEINKIAMRAKKSGVITIGGGVIKHHILNANIWRNGADFGVFINTGISYDCSDAGATPNEAVSWGKLQINSDFVKIFSEASLIFPILVAETFVKNFELAERVSSQNLLNSLESKQKIKW